MQFANKMLKASKNRVSFDLDPNFVQVGGGDLKKSRDEHHLHKVQELMFFSLFAISTHSVKACELNDDMFFFCPRSLVSA